MIAHLIPQNKRLTITVHERAGFTPAEAEKHKVACQMLETVLNSVEFGSKVYSLKLVRTNGLTNAEVYRKIMSGKEDLDEHEDSEVDVYVSIYHAHNSVVGYTKPSTVKTWLNRKFFSQYDYSEVACNLFHEWLHKLGFDHIHSKDYQSVPYALGYLVEEMIKDLMAGAKFTDISTVGTVEAPTLPVILPIKEVGQVVCRRSWRTLWLKKVCRVVD